MPCVSCDNVSVGVVCVVHYGWGGCSCVGLWVFV